MLAVFRVDVEKARATLPRMEDAPWGVRLRGSPRGERPVVLPAAVPSNPPWTVGRRPASKVPGE